VTKQALGCRQKLISICSQILFNNVLKKAEEDLQSKRFAKSKFVPREAFGVRKSSSAFLRIVLKNQMFNGFLHRLCSYLIKSSLSLGLPDINVLNWWERIAFMC
jgi:hypothetical protein